MALPHRVCAVQCLLGDSTGETVRDAGHTMDPNPGAYGWGNHEYFQSYPLTTPSNVITKVAGTLGEDYDASVSAGYSTDTLPKNIFSIVCYSTTVNHYLPKMAWTRNGTYDAFNSSCCQDPTSPYFGDFNAYSNDFGTAISKSLGDSFETVAGTIDIIDDPSQTPGNLRHLYPRWTDETAYEMKVQPYEDAIHFTPHTGDTYYLTSDASGNPEDFISPWYVTYYSGAYHQVTRGFCDFSYQFTGLNPFLNRQPIVGYYGFPIADVNPSQWTATTLDGYNEGYFPVPTGAYLTTFISAYPINRDTGDFMFIDYRSTATHGLFLDSELCCWNNGTVVEFTVHIWKAPPKIVFRPQKTYVNWKQGSPIHAADYYPRYNSTDQHYDWKDILCGRCYGSPGERHGVGTTGLQYVELGGPGSGDGAFSPAEPNSQDLHYWGHIWGVDYDSENCVEVEARTFTITIDSSNAQGDAAPTDWGTKVADIELPLIEGYFTYIKDYEVTSITKPGEAVDPE